MDKSRSLLKASSPYNAAITREQFLFYEMRTTAKLRTSGLNDEEVAERVIEANLFQYPTEKSVRKIVLACLRRLDCLQDDLLAAAIANQSSAAAKQICLYAMMKQYRLVWDFMITVIGEKYRLLDMTFRKIDMNSFFFRLQEQDDWVSTWSNSTITKLKQVLQNILVENEYLDSVKSEELRPVLICSVLENAIRVNGDDKVLPAFNCFL